MMSIPSGGGVGVGWLVMDEYSFGGGEEVSLSWLREIIQSDTSFSDLNFR